MASQGDHSNVLSPLHYCVVSKEYKIPNDVR